MTSTSSLSRYVGVTIVSASVRERERETFVQKERADCEAMKIVINTLTQLEIEFTDFGF